MTVKLYDADSHATEFDACVVSCVKSQNKYKTELDRTLFFPEEGGQCSDRGSINGTEITYVELCGDTIYHYSDTPFTPGETVHGKIDFKLRFRNMQNHSGEHIICGIANKLFGYDNVGFHLGEDYVTMDLNGVLTDDDIRKIELLANEAVVANLTVSAFYPSKDELKNMNFRSKGSISDNVRVVTIGDVDACACCAPHVNSTGEIGLIKILDYMHYKGGMRLNILCGFDALNDYHRRYTQTAQISSLISVKQDEVSSGVEKLLGDMATLRAKLGEKNRQIIKNLIDSTEPSGSALCIFCEDADQNLLRLTANDLKAKTSSYAVVLSGNDKEGYKYVIACENADVSQITKDANLSLCGKGGGRGAMSSGTFAAKREEIESFFKSAG